MSRFIDHDKPYSQEDIDYLNTRSGGDYLIEVNQRKFGSLSEEDRLAVVDQVDSDDNHDDEQDAILQGELDALPDFDEDVIEKVAPLSFNELRQQATKLKLGGDGTKDELQDKLLNYFQDLKDTPAEKAKVETVTE